MKTIHIINVTIARHPLARLETIHSSPPLNSLLPVCQPLTSTQTTCEFIADESGSISVEKQSVVYVRTISLRILLTKRCYLYVCTCMREAHIRVTYVGKYVRTYDIDVR